MPEDREAVSNTKRVFFAYRIEAPWPGELPGGRLLAAEDRHATVAFLGDVDYAAVEAVRDGIPQLPCTLAPVGVFDETLLLPPRRPRVVAWHVDWWTLAEAVAEHVAATQQYLVSKSLLRPENRPWLPHVTLCRNPRSLDEWQAAFKPRPLIATGCYLYESIGKLRYRPLWGAEFLKPFTRCDEEGKVVFLVKGASKEELYLHARIARAFHLPKLISALEKDTSPVSFADAVTQDDSGMYEGRLVIR